jgi:hypothetical protein
MCAASSQILYSFLMMPQTLPPSYVRFIQRVLGKDRALIDAFQVCGGGAGLRAGVRCGVLRCGVVLFVVWQCCSGSVGRARALALQGRGWELARPGGAGSTAATEQWLHAARRTPHAQELAHRNASGLPPAPLAGLAGTPHAATASATPCAFLHPGQGCYGHAASQLPPAYGRALAVYLPVYLVPAALVHRHRLLRRPAHILPKVALGVARSSLFLSLFITLAFTGAALAAALLMGGSGCRGGRRCRAGPAGQPAGGLHLCSVRRGRRGRLPDRRRRRRRRSQASARRTARRA